MTGEKQKSAEPHGPPRLGEPGEHPLSILLFSWMRTTLFFRILMALLAGGGTVLVILEVVLVRRAYLSLESLPGFFAAFGFVALAFAVLSAWPLSRLLRRPEDYYDTSSGEAGRDR